MEEIMRRILCLLTAAIMIAGLCACSKGENQDSQPVETSTSTEAQTTAGAEASEEPVSLIDSDVTEWVDYKEYNLSTDEPVKNIILMIGDGMGENIIKAAEIVKGDKLVLDGIENRVYVNTDSLSGTTDSAAASTAMSCGIKTYNKYLGVDENGEAVETMCEFAQARGLKTGLVVTQIMPHATPAGMVCHYDARTVYNTLFKQMLKANVDVLFGGGSEYYKGSALKAAESNSYQYVTDEDGFMSLSKDKKALGLFRYNAIYGNMTPSLCTMTQKALELLSNEDGFFLMVEGSNIDVKENALDMDGTMLEMQSFDKTVDYVLSWAEDNPGTLVLVTADHETGGVTIPDNATAEDINNDCFTSDGEHTNVNVLLFASGAQSDKLFTEDVIENTDISKIMREQLNATYGEAEVKLLNEANR